jgi:hypothetical protein
MKGRAQYECGEEVLAQEQVQRPWGRSAVGGDGSLRLEYTEALGQTAHYFLRHSRGYFKGESSKETGSAECSHCGE